MASTPAATTAIASPTAAACRSTAEVDLEVDGSRDGPDPPVAAVAVVASRRASRPTMTQPTATGMASSAARYESATSSTPQATVRGPVPGMRAAQR
jgi:hypothetical protein